MMYICEGCGELVPDALGLEDIDSGTVLDCPKCQDETIVDLFRPEERQKLYKAQALIALLPKTALWVLVTDNQGSPNHLAWAKEKIREWLNTVD